MSNPTKYANNGYGFAFHAPHFPTNFDASRLDVILRDQPTKLHFDPEIIELTTRVGDGRVDRQTFAHPWPWENEHWVCPGWVTLVDRKNARVTAYTFGGNFEIHSQDHKTVCTLELSAPILELNTGNEISRLLAAEVEILLAEQRAKLLPDLSIYESWLSNLDPLEFYATCLAKLQEKFDEFPDKSLPGIQDFLNFLEAETQILKRNRKWPAKIIDFALPD